MHPVLFRIPGLDFPIRTFGVLVAAGILLSISLWGRFLARYGDDPRNDPIRGSQIALWVVVGILVGARLMYVSVEIARYLRADVSAEMASYLQAENRAQAAASIGTEGAEAARKVVVGYDFLHDPFKIFLIWQGGLVMYGGLIGGVLVGVWMARRHQLDVWNAMDTGLVCGFFGLMVGRWGCLFVGDDYGRIVPERFQDSWMPLQLSSGGAVGFLTLRVPELDWLRRNPESLFDHELAGSVLWSMQVWLSLNALLVALVGWAVLARRRTYGVAAAWMMIQYALGRFVIEYFRGDEIRGVWFGGALSTSQIVSILLAAFGIFLLVKRPGRKVAALHAV